jgi:hypothetical protein
VEATQFSPADISQKVAGLDNWNPWQSFIKVSRKIRDLVFKRRWGPVAKTFLKIYTKDRNIW